MAEATVTIYITDRGTALVDAGNGQPGESSVGHMWYVLNDGNGNSYSYGFAPDQNHHGSPFAPGAVYRNDISNYQNPDFSRTIKISQEQFDVMRDFGENPFVEGRFDSQYNGVTNSCIDFTWRALELGGLNPAGFQGDIWPTHNIDDVMNIGNLSLKSTKGKGDLGGAFDLLMLLGVVDDAPIIANTLSVQTNIKTTPSGNQTPDATSSISADNRTLGATSDYKFGSTSGNVNTDSGLLAVAYDLSTDGIRPGNFNLSLGSPTDSFIKSYGSLGFSAGTGGSLLNTGSTNLLSWTPTDPLVLDLNGDGVKLTNFTDAPVLFDADNDGGSKEQTGWVSAEDGIVVHDVNADGVINNIAETLSEYYKGVAGSNGVAGTKPYTNGFAALKSLDANADNVFNATDTAWSQLRVWVDANHDGKSWVDTDNDGVKDTGEASELKTFAELGITQINLTNTVQSGEVRDGNEVLARGTFVKSGVTQEALAANFLNNPAGSTITQTASGTTATLDGGTVKSFTSSNTNATVNESLSAATLAVRHVTGGAGNDTLTGDAQGNWLVGGLGADRFVAGAGDDVMLVDAADTTVAGSINGGDGLDMVQVVGSEGASLNMSASQVEIAVGNIGNDIIIGGGGTSVFVRGGDGDDLIVGSAANDALSGENGNDYVDGGAGNDIVRGHRGQDQVYGGSGDDIIEGGLEDDMLSGGDGNDVLSGDGGDDVIAGGDGTDVAQYSGSYTDYRVTQLNNTTWRVVDTKSGRDGADVLTNVERLSFSDISQIKLSDISNLPVKDVLTQDGSGNTLARTGAYYISKSQLLSNDQSWQGKTLKISSVLDAKGGTATLVTNTSDPRYGDVLFTPDANYKGVMSFKYQVQDLQGNFTNVIDSVTGNTQPMRATVYLQTPDLPADPLALEQWYLSDANILPVWNDYTGKGIRIGQFEPGGPFSTTQEVFDYRHADLQANVDKAWLNDPAAVVPQTFSNHATLVAGVMVAARNGEGAVGVAYDAKLSGHYVPGNGLEVGNLAQQITDVLAKFKNYDVVNNSWAATDDFVINVLPVGTLENGIKAAVETGRNGLGTAIVMAGGNDRQDGGNTNTNALSANQAVITVGSINAPSDLGSLQLGQKPFSNPGASILVSAPGSNINSTSRELVNDNGSVFGSDTSVTQGTSFAAPIVSGVVALMLEANPLLGYRDIQTILAMSATKFDDPNGTDWTYNGAKNWNGGGMHASHDYGFGKVDARAAVRLAETWFDQSTAFNGAKTSGASAVLNASIGDGTGTYSNTLNMAAGLEVESAQVTVEIDHQRWGDLIVKLISPSGNESILLNRPGKAPGSAASDVGSTNSGVMNFSFNTTHVRGEQSAGAWRIQVQDAVTGSVGTVKSWKLDLYGSSADANDNYVYTDEFSTFTGTQRSTLADTNGGKDILNASAIRTGSNLNINSGTTSTIAGKSLTISGDIEYAYGGDGNDTITGNALSNVLQGGRGSDTLSGGAGLDVLIGGAGSNSLTGGADADIFVIRRSPGAVDTIQDFSVTSGAEKIALVGFSTIDDYTKLSIAAEGTADTRISLGDGQSILIKGVTPSLLSEQNFSFFADNAVFSKYLEYVSNDLYAASPTVGNDTFIMTSTNGNLRAYGLAGNDQLASRSQRDLLDGGNGNDTLWGDYVDVPGGYPVITTGSDWLEGGAGNDILKGGGSDDSLIGGSGNDELYGEEGQDWLIGSTGLDYLGGGNGNDTITLDGDVGTATATSTDFLGTRVGGAGADLFKVLIGGGGSSSVSFSGTQISASNLIADFQANQAGEIIDLTSFNWIRGFADLSLSQTTINGLGGTRVSASNGTSSISLFLLNVVPSSLNKDHFVFVSNPGFVGGLAGADSLIGDAGANTLDGAAGADSMTGRTGDDTYAVDNVGDVVNELPGGGFDSVNASVTYTLSENVEVLTLSGSANLNGTGNSERNRIRGNSGNNRLDGGKEADDLLGGAGNDTYVVDDQLDSVSEILDQGTDTVESSVSWVLSPNVENLTLTGTQSINATGNELGNVLIGNQAANVLDGGAGADTMQGGMGNDTYYIDDAGDLVTEATDAGVDTVYVPFTYTLSPDLENAALYGDATASLNGNGQANSLQGNPANNSLVGFAGDDWLDGGAGADSLTGGIGNDTYVIDNTGDVVTELVDGGVDEVVVGAAINYTLTPNVENGSLLTGTSLIGNALANRLVGSGDADTLNGGAENDTLLGGAGADGLTGGDGLDSLLGGLDNDTLVGNAGDDWLQGDQGIDSMSGGDGSDTYIVDNTTDVITEAYSYGNAEVNDADVVWAYADYTLPVGVETLILDGAANLNAWSNANGGRLSGNDGNNYLHGAEFFDTLEGGVGVDTLAGGLEDDVYVLSDGDDVILENANAGYDIIQARTSASILMAENVEEIVQQINLIGLTATGNSLNNVMRGSTGKRDVLTGAGGNDTLYGYRGNDDLTGGTGDDFLLGDQGSDTYFFNRGDGKDRIYDAQAVSSPAETDKLIFQGSVASSQLWFARSGNSLLISVIGTQDSTLVQNWFAPSSTSTYQIEQIQAMGDSKTLLNTEVDQLIQVMSGMTPPPLGQTTLTAAQQQALTSVFAATWS